MKTLEHDESYPRRNVDPRPKIPIGSIRSPSNTSTPFGWASVTLHDGPISVEAAFRRDELERLARAAGISDAKVRAHRPAFRVSLVAPRVL